MLVDGLLSRCNVTSSSGGDVVSYGREPEEVAAQALGIIIFIVGLRLLLTLCLFTPRF